MSYALFGIGNALVDIVYRVSDKFITQHGLTKGQMHLIEEARAKELDAALTTPPLQQSSGGSVANSIYSAQSFGASSYFAGKVADDSVGRSFNDDLQQIGANTNPVSDAAGLSGRCMVLVTADAERTMNTCLGVSDTLSVADVSESAIASSQRVFIEGYLASSPTGRLAAIRTREIADQNQLETNLTISDISMIEVYRSELTAIIGNGLTRIFTNIREALAWCKTDRLDIALNELSDVAKVPIITLGEQGCIVGDTPSGTALNAHKVEAINVNGAGDMFAGAYLAAIAAEESEANAARFGNFTAGRLVTRVGTRFETPHEYTQLWQSFKGP